MTVSCPCFLNKTKTMLPCPTARPNYQGTKGYSATPGPMRLTVFSFIMFESDHGFSTESVHGFRIEPVHGFTIEPLYGFRIEPVHGFSTEPVPGAQTQGSSWVQWVFIDQTSCYRSARGSLINISGSDYDHS